MSAQIIQFVPRSNPNRTAVTMEQQAIGIVDYINGLTGIPYGGSGIDGMELTRQSYASTLADHNQMLVDRMVGVPANIDTQANAFHAPENDPA